MTLLIRGITDLKDRFY